MSATRSARAKDQGAWVSDVIKRREAASPAPQPLAIGARLRSLRRDRGLTLQDASRLSGVSTSAFSKIERDELSPTISTMQRIAAGFGVELASLLSDGAEGRAAFRGRRSVSRAGEGNNYNTRTCDNVLLCADLKDKRITPVLTRVTARSPEDYAAWAQSDAEIFVMVLEGTLVVHSRLYEPLELERGDSIYYDASVEHAWTSKGPHDASVLWVLTLG
jgi:transcriptional regulator with XRE-family HTH domain